VKDILEKYGQEVESIDLIPTSGGKFEFYLNGELSIQK
jgi:Uncharacterized protein conserved in bacteria